MVEPRGTDSARVIRVIETKALRGEGTQENLSRIVTQYWDFEGNLLAENDPCITESAIQGDA
ncbi:carboxypeptidase [Faecalimonas umbilicata]|nr:carboxypeptidase [Faecalimonas umbilicata]